MGAHVDGHRLIGNEPLFRDHQAYWDGHRDALFISSIQEHLTTISPRWPLPVAGPVRIVHGWPSHSFPCTAFFLVHCLIRCDHQFAERNGALGIEPRHSNGEG
jgi:hypothetical protein